MAALYSPVSVNPIQTICSRFSVCPRRAVNHATYEDKDAPMKDMTLEQWNNTLTTNLTSTFLVIRAFLRQLESQSDEAAEDVVSGADYERRLRLQ